MWSSKYVLLALLVLLAGTVSAETAVPDPWAPVRILLGQWSGTTNGQPGDGSVTREYDFILNDRFIRERNTSTYPPQEKNKRGEIHEHLAILSYDKARRLLVLRQFHIEGFVNQFVLRPALTTAMKVVFESEHFENFSNEWRARETYDILGLCEFTETFELAPPNQPFETYSTNHFYRVGSQVGACLPDAR